MKISIIGAGSVGQALAKAFIRSGNSVFIGVTNPIKYAEVGLSLGAAATLGLVAEAIAYGDIIILAVPFRATDEIAASINDWQGKILVDATNPIAPGLQGLLVGTNTSGAEILAQHAKNARVVKAFNTTGAENMANATYSNSKIMMPVCGDDTDARHKVMALAETIGFEALDMGALHSARYLEPLAMVWIHLAIKQGYGRDFAFGLHRRA
jgi:predicted dinucleotide-binding enzyme